MNYLSKLLTMSFLCSMLGITAYGQGAYVSLHTGYGVNMGSQNSVLPPNYSDKTMETTNSSTSSYTEEQVNVSLGKGIEFGGSVGYKFNDHVRVDLGLSYLIGATSSSSDEYRYEEEDEDYKYKEGEFYKNSISSKMFRINPSIVLAAGGDKLNPYVKFGLLFGSGTVIRSNNYEVFEELSYGTAGFDKETYEFSYTEKMNGGIAFGLTSGIGAELKLNDKMFVFGELRVVNMSYAPTKGKITEMTEDGEDLLKELTISEKEYEYVNSYTVNENEEPSDNKPTQLLKEKLPFGSAGLNFGIRMNL